MAVYANVQDLQDTQTAIINLSKTLHDIDGNIGLAVNQAHEEWKDTMYDEFKKLYDKYKQRVAEIAVGYEKFAKGPLQEKINELIIIEEKAKQMNQ